MKIVFKADSVKQVLVPWAGLLIIVLGFLFGTSPDRIGPVGVSLFFIILYLLAVSSIHLVVIFLRKIIARPKHLNNWTITYSLITGFGPVLLISLQSLDQLALRDGVIFLGLAMMLIFYLSRISKK